MEQTLERQRLEREELIWDDDTEYNDLIEDKLDEDEEKPWEIGFEQGEQRANDDMVEKSWNDDDY